MKKIDRPSKFWEIEKHRKVHTFSVYTSGFQQRQITAPKKRDTILLTIFPINFTQIWNRFEIYGMAEVQIWTRCDIPINWYIDGNIEIELLISVLYYSFKSNFSTVRRKILKKNENRRTTIKQRNCEWWFTINILITIILIIMDWVTC